MPGNDLKLKIEPTGYSTNDTRYFGAYIDLHMEDYYFGEVGHDMNGIMGRAGVYTSKVGNTTQTPKYNENASGYDGKLNISSFGIGVYDGGANPAWIRERKFKQVTSGVSTYDKQNSKQSANNQQHQEVYTSLTGTSKVTMPVGTRTPDQDVEMTFEVVAGKYAGQANKQAAYTPSVLHVDVYQGKDNYNTQNFVRQDFTLPIGGQKVTHELDMGGTVTIEAVTYSSKGNYKINMSGATGKEGLREWENNWMYGYPREMRNELENAPSDNVFNLQWYKYKVTVSGCSYAWKLGMETEYSGSSNYITAALEGIEAGSAAQSSISSADQVTGSYISRGNPATYIPLVEGFQVSRYNMLSDNSFIYALKPKDGYSKPETSAVQGNSTQELTPVHADGTAVKDGEVQRPDAQGRFLFKLYPKQGSDNTNPPTYLHFTSKPIKLHTSYYYEDKKYSQTDQEMTLSLSNGDAQNQVIELLLPTELETATDQFLQGYKVYVVPESGGDKLWELKPDDNGTYWNSGDVINFNHDYSQMVENGWLDDTSETYELRITAVADSSNANGLVKTGYGVYIQKGWFRHTTSGSDYGAGNFMEIGGSADALWAFNGQKMTLTGYKNPLDRTKTNQGFFKVGLRSTLTADVRPNQKVANLYYLSAVKASIDIAEIQGDNAVTEDFKEQVEAWNSAQAGTLFTSVNEENHVVHYEDIDTNLPKTLSDGRKFLGWRVKDPNGGTYSENIPQTGKINLFTLGSNQNSGSYGDYSGDVFARMYKDLFGGTNADGSYQGGSGQLVLVPVYSSSKIESNGTDMITSATAVTTHTGGSPEAGVLDGSFEIKGTFKGTADSLKGAEFAVTKQEKQRDADTGTENGSRTKLIGYGYLSVLGDKLSTPDIQGSYAGGAGKLELTGGSVDAAGTFTLTFQINSVQDSSNAPSISYQWDHEAVYTIHVWNDGNTGGTALTPEKLKDLASTTQDKTSEVEAALLDTSKDIPGVSTQISVLPKKVTNADGSGISALPAAQEAIIYAEQDFILSADFAMDPHYPASLQTGTAATGDGKIHTALYKKKNGTECWVFDGSVLTQGQNNGGTGGNKVDAGAVTAKRGESGKATVTFTFANQTNSSNKPTVSQEYEDGAVYYIVAWNGTNQGSDSFTSSSLNPDSGQHQTDAPSVYTTLKMSRISSNTTNDMITQKGTVTTYTGGTPEPKLYNGQYQFTGQFKFDGEAEKALKSFSFAVTKQEDVHAANSSTVSNEYTKLVGYGKLSYTKTDGVQITEQLGMYLDGNKIRMAFDADNSAVDENANTLTLAFNRTSNDTNKITYQYEEDAVYTIHVWSSGNPSIPTDATLKTLADGSNSNNPQSFTGQVEDTFLKEDSVTFPGVSTPVKVLPKKVSNADGSGISAVQVKDPLIIYAEQGFTLSANFAMDSEYPTSLQTGTAAAGDAKIHTALYKKKGSSTQCWVFDGSVQNAGTSDGAAGGNKVDTGAVTAKQGETGKATVTFNFTNQINSSNKPTISQEYEDGATYYIVAWNKANQGEHQYSNGSSLNPDTGTYKDDAPSVYTTLQMSKISSNKGGDTITQNGTVTTHTGGTPEPEKYDGRYQFTGQFKFDGEAEKALKDVSFAVTKREKVHGNNSTNVTNNYTKLVGYGSLTYTNAGGVQITEQLGMYLAGDKIRMAFDAGNSKVDTGAKTLTLAFNRTSDNTNRITYRYEDEATYTIHVWSNGNSSIPTDTTLKTLADGSNSNRPQDFTTQVENTFLAESSVTFPGVSTDVKVLPKAVATTAGDRGTTAAAIQQITKDTLKIAAEQDFNLTAGFQIDTQYPTSLQTGNGASEEAKVRTAIYKKDKGSTTWENWVFDGQLDTAAYVDDDTSKEAKVSKGSITGPTSGNVTVQFDFTNRTNAQGESTISFAEEDGAQYCIVAWNASNVDNKTNASKDELNPGTGTYKTNAPSITTPLTLQWGADPTYYVYIPANVVLTEGGANVSGGNDGYAGAEATVRYKTAAEGNTKVDQPEVEVQVQDGEKLAETGGSKDMTMGIYGYVYIGLLTTKTGITTWTNGSETLPAGKSFGYQINAKTNGKEAQGTTYTGAVNYILTLRNWTATLRHKKRGCEEKEKMRGRKTIHHLKKFLTCAGLCLLMAAVPKTGLQAEAAEGSINVTYMVTTARPDAGSTTIRARPSAPEKQPITGRQVRCGQGTLLYPWHISPWLPYQQV